MKPLRHKYKVRKWLGQYQSWYLKLYGKQSFRKCNRFLEKFFQFYPNKIYLTQFSEEDIHDWVINLKREGYSNGSVGLYLNRVRAFWRWCVIHKGLTVLDAFARIVANRNIEKAKRARNKKTLNSLEELRVIYAKIESEELRTFIISAIKGTIPKAYKTPARFKNEFLRASQAAGFDYTVFEFRRSVPKLRRWIFEYFHNQLSDALTLKTESLAYNHSHVEVAPLDIGTSISNSTYNSLPGSGIN